MTQIDVIRNKSLDELTDKFNELIEQTKESNLLKRKLLKMIAHLGLIIEDIDQNISKHVARDMPEALKRSTVERCKLVSKIFMNGIKEDLSEETEILEFEKMLFRPKMDK